MVDEKSELQPDKSPAAPDAESLPHSKAGFGEKDLRNEGVSGSGQKTFKKTTYWHQQSPAASTPHLETLLYHLSEQLVRIEAKLSRIETLLDQ